MNTMKKRYHRIKNIKNYVLADHGAGSNVTDLESRSKQSKCSDEESSVSMASDSIGLGASSKRKNGESLESGPKVDGGSPLTGTGADQASSIPAASVSTPGISAELEAVLSELRDRRQDSERFNEKLDSINSSFQRECTMFNQALQEERFRYDRLEELMNDFIELHQNQIENLKTGINDMEEKVQYQSEERLRDIHELLENCQTRISRMEHQQHQHLQQLVNIDSFENSNARALVLKLINVLLYILQVILLLVAIFANIVTPFLQTRFRILTTFLFLILFLLFIRQWPTISSDLQVRFGDRFPYIISLLPGGGNVG